MQELFTRSLVNNKISRSQPTWKNFENLAALANLANTELKNQLGAHVLLDYLSLAEKLDSIGSKRF